MAVKVALVLWSGDLGGAEQHTLSLAVAMREQGVDARVAILTQTGPLCALLDANAVPFAALGTRRGRQALIRPRRLARFVAAAGEAGAILLDAGRLAAALRLGGYEGTLVGVEHGNLLNQSPGARRVVDVVDRWVASRLYDAQVAVSSFMESEVRRHPHASQLTRIHNGVNLSRFRPAPNPSSGSGVRFCFAGRLTPGKGVEVLLRAFAELPRQTDAELVIAGDGPMRGELETLVDQLGCSDRVSFEGWVPDVPSLMQSCDVATTPATDWVESFCMSAAEAMASGLPVLASDRGALPEIVGDGVGGTILPPGNIDAWAAAIERYAQDSTLRENQARTSRLRVEQLFDIRNTATQYLELLSS